MVSREREFHTVRLCLAFPCYNLIQQASVTDLAVILVVTPLKWKFFNAAKPLLLWTVEDHFFVISNGCTTVGERTGMLLHQLRIFIYNDNLVFSVF